MTGSSRLGRAPLCDPRIGPVEFLVKDLFVPPEYGIVLAWGARQGPGPCRVNWAEKVGGLGS